MPLKVVRDSYGGGREAYEARMILVRPDRYIAWTGISVSDATALLGKAVGRATAPADRPVAVASK